MYRLMRILYPLGVAKRMIGLFTDVQLANRRSALEQYRVVKRGLLVYGLVTATPSANINRSQLAQHKSPKSMKS
jgi:hypothetical protein